MIRVLLITPPAPERLGAPLLGCQYIAAALLAQGCEVRVIDAAASHFNHDSAWIIAEAEAFAPHLVGIGLYTRWVWHAYRLVEQLIGRFPLLVAGGPHATVRPREVLEHGFHIAIAGEAEKSILRIVDWLKGRAWLANISGIHFRKSNGAIHSGPPPHPIADLDSLPQPQGAQHLFDPHWYNPKGNEVIAGGILTSRGCPARCTFCANYVTGRRLRLRSPSRVVDELKAWHTYSEATFFSFWDDTLTASKKRVFRLCDVLQHEIHFNLRWTANAQASTVTPELFRAMRIAGCVAVNFGLESGDERILHEIGKGLTTQQAQKALEWAKAEGLQTTCNFMLGFPQETPHSLKRSLRFMEKISPLVDNFSTMGVVVPFPGTPLYEELHERYGFTNWWLREECSRYEPLPALEPPNRFYEQYVDDPNLRLDFFHYSDEMREMIRTCLRFKAEHNLRRFGLLGKQDRPVGEA